MDRYLKTFLALIAISMMIVGTMAPAMAVSSKAYSLEDNLEVVMPEVAYENEQTYVQGEILVKFNPGVSEAKINAMNSKNDATVTYTSPYAGFKVLKIPKTKSVEEMVEIYSKNPNVEYAEPNFIASTCMIPNDYYYYLQWHLNNSDYGGINMEAAWNISDGTGVIVAVLDTGVAYEDYNEYIQASDLAGTNFVPGYDFVNNDYHPNDDNHHGTHVTGTIAQSTNNNDGVAGVAYNCSIMPVKVLGSDGSGSYASIANGIYYATNNSADVISMSLGGSVGSTTLENAVAYAYNNGVTIVCAAGNNGRKIISYPAAYDAYCIAVGATRYDETRARYSNYGVSLDIMAPGGDMNVDQNGDGYADGVLQQTFSEGHPTDMNYYFLQGTSMATPHVAGVAALVISNAEAHGKTLTTDEVREAIQSSAEDLGSSGWDSTYGWGLVDAYAALNYYTWNVAQNQPPVANAGGPYSGTEGQEINFDGRLSTDPDVDSLEYMWDFDNDGTWDTGWSSSSTASYIYDQNGTYTVKLNVTDGKAFDTNTTTVTILDTNPKAEFSYTTNGLTVQFTDASESYDGITSWEWEFGDENIDSSSLTPTHTYASGGTYTVNLTVYEADGDSSTISQKISVTDQTVVDNIMISNITLADDNKTAGKNYFIWAIATVEITDINNIGVKNAIVNGHWSGDASVSGLGTTDEYGKVTFQSESIKATSGNFTFNIDNVVLDGYIYDILNSEINDTINVGI